tara:strand:+ start:164 stop:1798 length:1635 start_codon:yes stop_codon:yes gene_type:complete
MNEEEELKEELERYERQNQEAYDKEVSGENFLRDRAKKKEEEEEKQEPDPDEGIAGADFTFEQALLTKGRSLIGVGTAGIVRNIYTKISKIPKVQEMLTEAQEQLPSISQRGVEDFKRQAASRVASIIQKLKDQFPADDVEGLVMELDKKKKKKKAVNKKPYLKRQDADIVPTINDIKDAMSRIGDKRNQMTAKQIRRFYLDGVRNIKGLRDFMNVKLREGLPAATDKGAAQNLRDLAEYLEMTPADLSNIIKDNDVSVNKIEQGKIRKGKDIKTMGDLNEAMLTRMERLRGQPHYNLGHATSVQKILEQYSTGATRPDNIFLERARSIYNIGPDGELQRVGAEGNLARGARADDPEALQRFLGFAPSIEESVYNLTQVSEQNLAKLYEELGIDASDLDVRPSADASRLVPRELKPWAEATARSLIEKSNIDPEKAVDYLLDLTESIGAMLADAQKRGEVQALLKLDPGLAAEFLSRSGFRPKDRLILGKKGRPRKLNLSEQDRLILEEAEKFFQKNPLPGPKRQIKKKKGGDDTPPAAPVTRK